MKIFKLRKVLILYKIIFYVYIFLTKRSSALTNQKKKKRLIATRSLKYYLLVLILPVFVFNTKTLVR